MNRRGFLVTLAASLVAAPVAAMQVINMKPTTRLCFVMDETQIFDKALCPKLVDGLHRWRAGQISLVDIPRGDFIYEDETAIYPRPAGYRRMPVGPVEATR